MFQEMTFPSINRGYNRVFQPGRLSIGLVAPLENYPSGPVPSMERHLERAQLAERAGFSALWLRDVPFNVPSFGDAGQVYDPFVYLGFLAAHTNSIALGVASLVLPLRHPAHVAKAAASVDHLSNGRLILGIASGDRPDEYPAFRQNHANRGQRFRESVDYIRSMAESSPFTNSTFGHTNGDMDLLPKPLSGKIPLLITGSSQQHPQWAANNGDGWITYPRDVDAQQTAVTQWRASIASEETLSRPVMQSLYVDLEDDPNVGPVPIHLGFRSGINALKKYLESLEGIGVNHVALNLRFNRAGTESTIKQLADELLPYFPSSERPSCSFSAASTSTR
ncbi:LLM class oxidoreductase [uncultured Alcanivorax sp.]|jgi:luciferase-type oxidoreductase|uniref:LLM class oxidoreductase n=1 Tax=uncultured Alcanivorax sp. TaxID=191215 RepID=UPI0025D47ED6|nr:LLM class oxidoreductase [uncultured Alcanivorax sp.]